MTDPYTLLHRTEPAREPFFSIAIPHYQRRPYLVRVLETLFTQTFRDFEIVICDDGSTDDSAEVVPQLLELQDIAASYFRRTPNAGFGRNLAATLSRCRGRYIFLLGNDDQLAGPDVLREVHDALIEMDCPALAFTSYFDCERAYLVDRTPVSADLGSGPEVILRHFRNFAFMSGLTFDRDLTHKELEGAPIHSIYLQIYLAMRIVGSGGRLASIACHAVDKSISLGGSHAADWARRIRQPGEVTRRMTYDDIAIVAAQGLAPASGDQPRTYFAVLRELFLYSIPDALIAYRAAAGRGLAIRFGWAARPSRVVRLPLQRHYRLLLWLIFAGAMTTVFAVPISALERLKPWLAAKVRARRIGAHR